MREDEHMIPEANPESNMAQYAPWPRFAMGGEITIQGYQFKVLRINMNSIVLQPMPIRGYDSPRKLVRLMTGDGI
jgi:hypothetical protein